MMKKTNKIRLNDHPCAIRPPASSDEVAMAAFYHGLDEQSRRARFHGFISDRSLSALVHSWCTPEPGTNGLIVCDVGGAIVAHALYVITPGGAAEIAFVVADGHRHRGIASLLLSQLMEQAHEARIDAMVAHVQPHNHHMLHVFRDSGHQVGVENSRDEVCVLLDTRVGRAA
jgi:ribosomal protein S18 acetylase RimI-like enzyme